MDQINTNSMDQNIKNGMKQIITNSTRQIITNSMKQIIPNSVPQFDITTTINERLEYLEAIRQQIEVYLESAPPGNLSVFSGSSSDCFRYYNRGSTTDKYGHYLKKEEEEKRDELAKKKYYELLNKNINEEMKKIRKILSFHLKDSVIDTYTRIHPGIRKLIHPINVDDMKLAEEWERVTYHGNPFDEQDTSEFFSDKGERMRSKSEVLIANSLFHRGILYKYEYPIILNNGKTRYPDFTILNMKRRKVFYWEHLGKMGDNDYVIRNVRKISEYGKSGIVLGDKLLLTMETESIPLSTKDIENVINVILQ